MRGQTDALENKMKNVEERTRGGPFDRHGPKISQAHYHPVRFATEASRLLGNLSFCKRLATAAITDGYRAP
jgi:hypothetical protein